MGIIDYIIILLIISAGITGAKNGFFKQSVILIGTIVSFILAWIFKDLIVNFLSYNIPFFDFAGPLEGLTSLNIILYELIAFIFLLSLFASILIIVIKFSGVFEKILKMTLVLSLPSKILGFFVGLIEGYIIVFTILFFLNQPVFNNSILEDSTMAKPIINSSPGLSNIVGKMNDAANDVYYITKDYTVNKNVNKTNKEIVDALLNHKVIDKDYLNKLREKDKINY